MHVLFAVWLCLGMGVLSHIEIRPSDHVLSGTDYHRYTLNEYQYHRPGRSPPPPGLLHRIRRPGDVALLDPGYDFWDVVDLPPVPRFSIDTDVSEGPRDVWDRLVSLLLACGSPGHIPLLVDVGANLGLFSLAAASLGAHVIAFEPMSRNALKFSKSVARNKFEDRVTLFQNAVREDDAASVRLSDQPGRGIYGVDFVSATSLSRVIREDVDVLKIDAGGSENVVISGAKRLICNFRVQHILMNFTEVKKHATEMLQFLDAAGYTVSDVAARPLSIADYETFPPSIMFTLEGGKQAACEF